ncbi:uncharacterized protein OCT59_013514 [Rhizophagus irregularis]|uniref:uncharacterized protein n=1 Tax=Rhizophagus irregularis TaxID=588596 RepID=UPI00332DC2C3|nr:hypothetical protein OCT59_013514 [Rhizophagus irregularis]
MNFIKWTSGNEKIDNYIQEIQLKFGNILLFGSLFRWISYNNFYDIKVISKNDFNTLYSAIFELDVLYYNDNRKALIKVILKCLHNSQYMIDEFLNEVELYSMNQFNNNFGIYGISQDPKTKDYIMILETIYCEKCGKQYPDIINEWCKSCQIEDLKLNFMNWTSKNKIIDYLIQGIQLRMVNIVFEWIPYDQFNDIKQIKKSTNNLDNVNIYSSDEVAIWKDGPLNYNRFQKELIRESNKKVVLKYLHNLLVQNVQDAKELTTEIANYSVNEDNNVTLKIYGISQHPNTKDYILVIQNGFCENCAIWKDGPLSYKMEFTRESNKKVILNRICNSQNTIDEFFYKVNKTHTGILCGISQDPDTNDYIMVFQDGYCEKCGKECTNLNYKRCKSCQIHYLKLNMPNWVSENEQINDFIQNVQLNFNNISYDLLFQWIPYNEFYDVKEIEKIGNDDFDKIYSAIYFAIKKVSSVISTRIPTRITLKSLNNSQNMIDEFLIKVKTNIIDNNFKVYGISQNPNTKDYIMVLQASFCTICGYQHENISDQKWKSCQINYVKPNLISKSEQIDKFIQEIQLKINNSSDVIFEWIAYDQFYNIKEIRNDLSIALWKNGPLQYDIHKRKFSRNKYKKVALKYLQDMIDKDKIMKYIDNNTKDNKIYGISQNSDTKDYIMVFENKYCIECNKQYVDIEDEWCKSCRINEIEKFTNWTENEKIDNLIRELRLKINRSSDIIFEWIPYDQFSDIEEIGEGGFAKVYSAIWKRPTKTIANNNDIIYSTESEDEKVTVALKCIYNSQNITNEFLNEIKAYSIESSFFSSGILRIYGISQNPDTKEYIIVFEYAEGGDLIHWININFKNFEWSYKIEVLSSIIYSLGKIHQNQMVHRDFHPGNILFKDTFTSFYRYNTECNIRISDMGLCSLCEEVGKTDESKLCGVMPYMAPEVLRSNPYTQAADIYSFDANPDNRPNAIEIQESFKLFKEQQQYEIEGQFKEADKYKEIEAFIKRNQHPQAIYISRVLNLDFSISQPIYEPQNSIDVKHI